MKAEEYSCPVRTIRVGIVGLGYWGPNWLRNLSGTEGCTVQYGCDVNAERLRKLSRQYPAVTFTRSYDDLLADTTLGAIVIATPTSTHFALAKAALEAGKHVLVEKPMTTTAKEAAMLNEIARKRRRTLLVDHTFAYTPSVMRIAELAHGGTLGNLLYFDSTRINLGVIQKDTNVLWDLAIHDLTILSAIADFSELTELFACGSAFYGKQTEVGHLHLKFQGGLHAHIHVSWLSPVKIRQTLIGGTKAMITYDDTEPTEKLRIYDRGVDHDATKPDPFFPKYRSGNILIPALPLTEALSVQAQHFLACIVGKEQPRVSGEDGRRMVQLLALADQSLKQNKVIRVRGL